MPSVDFNNTPADVRWPVTRGDDENMPLQFFTTYAGPGNASNVPMSIADRTYTSHVTRNRGGTVICTPTVTVDDPATGELTITMTDAQTRLLTDSTYVWDLVENPGTTSESTLITGRMTVTGRATP